MCADALRLLRPGAETKADFFSMFSDGMSPPEARRLHESKLFLKEKAIELISNSNINPPERKVRIWHEQWREHNFGPQVAPLEKIKEKVQVYNQQGNDVFVMEDRNEDSSSVWAVAIVTPVMKRVVLVDYISK